MKFLNWRLLFVLFASLIIGASIYYTFKLSSRLAQEEHKKVLLLVEAIKTSNSSNSAGETGFALNIVTGNETIPLIIVDGNHEILSFVNIDTAQAKNGQQFLQNQLRAFMEMHAPIVSDFGLGKNYVYYGESSLLKELRIFPMIQLGIIFIFILVVFVAINTYHKSLQNQVWVGLSKETAHQLGTPLSSMEGWLEMLSTNEANHEAVEEMRKDIERLNLVADRFSKIGSVPQLKEEDLMILLREMVVYMKRRAPSKVDIQLESNATEVRYNLSRSLINWVFENLIRNALDALEGEGDIKITVKNETRRVLIDVTDTGRGMSQKTIAKIFNPGFSTKKRGWGLGLSLAKRIIEKYHNGSIAVKHSEIGKGTCFRILLRR